MTEVQKMNAAAKSAFNEKNYSLAFQTLWKAGISNFISFAQKEEPRNNKTNWFSHKDAASFFWTSFVLNDDVFVPFCTSDTADQLLHNYFSKNRIQSKEFELKLAEKFPGLFIRAVRVNQVFLNAERIESLMGIPLGDKFSLHKKLWKKIYEIESSHWQGIQEELSSLANWPSSDILSHCIIWLETVRFRNRDSKGVYHLATVYSFFIELLFNKYPEKNSCSEFRQRFLKILADVGKDQKLIEESNVARLLNRISHWLHFKEQVISPYSFDLNIEPTQVDELAVFNSTPEAHYKWLVNGVRYEVNQLYYLQQGALAVQELESTGETIIPKGKSANDEALNRSLAGLKWSTLLLLNDLGIHSFSLKGTPVGVAKLLSPLLTYSFNRLNRYEESLRLMSDSSASWTEAFVKLILHSIATDVAREPFFLMSEGEYQSLNKQALSEIPEDSTKEIVHLFSHNPFSRSHFNRFYIKYDVWQKPFIKIGENLFCPMMFFASNIWFYSFVQEGLMQLQTAARERKETSLLMENNFGEIISRKGWHVKVISDQEANEMKGDVDIFVEDESSLLFIQLKRTYFRLNLKDAYYDSINTDRKAAKQLNDAEEYLSTNNSIYSIRKKPVKWIVSTSFENIGEEIAGCRKVNYFELLNALKNPLVKELKDLIRDLESDKNLKEFVNSVHSPVLPAETREVISEIVKPLAVFESKKYQQVIFSEDEGKTEEYNVLFNDAIKHDAEGRKEEALKLFEKCASLRPTDGEIYSAIGNTLADMRLFDSSFYAFKKAMQLMPDDPYVSRNYSLALFEAGRFYEGLEIAINTFEKYPLLGDIRQLFEVNFEMCLRQGFLAPAQLMELKSRWSRLN